MRTPPFRRPSIPLRGRCHGAKVAVPPLYHRITNTPTTRDRGPQPLSRRGGGGAGGPCLSRRPDGRHRDPDDQPAPVPPRRVPPGRPHGQGGALIPAHGQGGAPIPALRARAPVAGSPARRLAFPSFQPQALIRLRRLALPALYRSQRRSAGLARAPQRGPRRVLGRSCARATPEGPRHCAHSAVTASGAGRQPSRGRPRLPLGARRRIRAPRVRVCPARGAPPTARRGWAPPTARRAGGTSARGASQRPATISASPTQHVPATAGEDSRAHREGYAPPLPLPLL